MPKIIIVYDTIQQSYCTSKKGAIFYASQGTSVVKLKFRSQLIMQFIMQ